MPKTRSALQDLMGKRLAALRRRRPLRSGSLIITLFGDALAPRGGIVALGSLIRLARPFGLTERLVRTSVARLAAEGWLEARRHGRQSDYRLTERGRARFAEATRRIYTERPEPWDGRWTLVILPKGTCEVRDRVREELKWLGFGPLAPGVFAHPGRALPEAREALRQLKLLDEVILMAGVAEAAENSELALAAWDLAGLGRDYRRFIAAFEPLRAALARARALDPEVAFVLRTLLIHEYRKVHLRDPLLPHSLLSPDWAGAAAYRLCRALYTRVFADAERFLDCAAATCRGALPPLSPLALQRFGGLLASRAD